jgi:hypothetical protein
LLNERRAKGRHDDWVALVAGCCLRLNRFAPIVLQNSFWIAEDKFSGLWARQSKNHVGTTAISDEFTGDFGGAFEATSIDGCRLFCRLAEI